MSYARWDDGSDVYVYGSTAHRFYCADCPRLGRPVCLGSAREMADHLELDRASGLTVPQAAIDRLRAEATP
jgi:hypothetical protein